MASTIALRYHPAEFSTPNLCFLNPDRGIAQTIVVARGVGRRRLWSLRGAEPSAAARAGSARGAELEQVAANRRQNRARIRSCDTREASQRSVRPRDLELAALRRQLIAVWHRKINRTVGRRTSANSQLIRRHR